MTRRICPECEARGEEGICPRCGTRTLFDAPSDAGIDPLIGRVFDERYRIESLLGQGGMGAVYEAVQIAMNKTVAVKVVRPELAANLEAARRFHREAKAASRLSHPHSVRVFDFGQTRDRELFMVMEYIEGRTLSELIRAEGRIPPGRAAKIGSEIVQALIEAHGLGFIHRDLKPDNVLLLQMPRDPEFVKVLDFGIVKFLTGSSGDSAMTRTGAVIGTPQYMAPEQSRASRHLSPATDLYAMGVILFHMLSGRLPFTGETPVEVLMAHVTEPAPELPADLEIPASMRALVRRMLDKRPSDRPRAEEVLETLETIRYEEIARRYGGSPGGASEGAPGPEPVAAARQVTEAAPPTPIDDAMETEWQADATHAMKSVAVEEPPSAELRVDVLGVEPSVSGLVRRSAPWLLAAGLSLALVWVLLSLGGHEQGATTPGAGDQRPASSTLSPSSAGPAGSSETAAAIAVEVVVPPPAPVPVVQTPDSLEDVELATDAISGLEDTAPPAEAAPPATDGKASMTFTSSPEGATVYLDGEKIGQTPFEARLSAATGRRDFVFKKKGHSSKKVSVEVQPRGQVVAALRKVKTKNKTHKETDAAAARPAMPKRERPQPATAAPSAPPSKRLLQMIVLRFTSDPRGARVYEGGKSLGTTPFEISLPSGGGARTFVCRKTGHRDDQVSVDGAASRNVRCYLEPLDF